MLDCPEKVKELRRICTCRVYWSHIFMKVHVRLPQTGTCSVNPVRRPNRAAAAPTCVFAGELGLGITHPPSPLAVLLVTAVLAVLVSVTSPAFWDAGPIRDAVEFFCATFDHRWQHWNKSWAWMKSSQICDERDRKKSADVSLYSIYRYLSWKPGKWRLVWFQRIYGVKMYLK